MKPVISDLLCWLLCSSQGTESPHICSFFLVGYMIHHSHLKLATCPDMLAFGFRGGYDFCILLSLVWLREFVIYDLSRIKGEEYFLFFFVRSPGQLEYKLGRELCILTLHSWVLSWMDKVKNRPCLAKFSFTLTRCLRWAIWLWQCQKPSHELLSSSSRWDS